MKVQVYILTKTINTFFKIENFFYLKITELLLITQISMAETSVFKNPQSNETAPKIETLDPKVLEIITKNPNKVKGCLCYNIDYNQAKDKNRFVSPTFTVSRVTIGLVESSDDFKKNDSPNYFMSVRKTGTSADTGDTDVLFSKITDAETKMKDLDEFSDSDLSSNIKTKDGKDPSIFFKLKYARKAVADPDNPKKTKKVTDMTRLSTKFYVVKKIDGKPVKVPLEFNPKEITKHIITNSIAEMKVTFDYAWKMKGAHGINVHIDEAILLPPKNVKRANDLELTVPDYMVASDSEGEGEGESAPTTKSAPKKAAVNEPDNFEAEPDDLDGKKTEAPAPAQKAPTQKTASKQKPKSK